jgi:L-threonylcarbamoyladenylate synthase
MNEPENGPTTERLGTGAADLARAAELLVAGGLVALPTETVYGLAVRADDPDAVGRLYAAKGRPADNPLIVHVASLDALARITTHVTPLARRLLAHFSPGPLTVVLDAHPDLPRAVTAGLDTVAVRIPDHPVTLAILERCGIPIAAPSANRSGRPSPTCATHVLDDLDGLIAAVVDGGPTRLGLESTVVDARGTLPVLLREGAVTREDLARIGGGVSGVGRQDGSGGAAHRSAADADAPRAPGTRHRHYAPGLPVHLVAPGSGARSAADLLAGLRDTSDPAARVGLVTQGSGTTLPDGIELLGTPVDAGALATELFALLRRAEDLRLSALVIEQVAEEGIGRAVMDRLRRAAEASGGSMREVGGPDPTDG